MNTWLHSFVDLSKSIFHPFSQIVTSFIYELVGRTQNYYGITTFPTDRYFYPLSATLLANSSHRDNEMKDTCAYHMDQEEKKLSDHVLT